MSNYIWKYYLLSFLHVFLTSSSTKGNWADGSWPSASVPHRRPYARDRRFPNRCSSTLDRSVKRSREAARTWAAGGGASRSEDCEQRRRRGSRAMQVRALGGVAGGGRGRCLSASSGERRGRWRCRWGRGRRHTRQRWGPHAFRVSHCEPKEPVRFSHWLEPRPDSSWVSSTKTMFFKIGKSYEMLLISQHCFLCRLILISSLHKEVLHLWNWSLNMQQNSIWLCSL